MSMLTAQSNHLREMAYTVERVKSDAVGKLSLSGSIALATAAIDMRDAADTIARLRNMCHDLQRENDKLHELAGVVREFVGDVNCGACYLRSNCDDNNRMGCGMELSYHAFEAMRDLGIEVGE